MAMRGNDTFAFGVDNAAHSLRTFMNNRLQLVDELQTRARQDRSHEANGGFRLACPHYSGGRDLCP